MASLWRSSRLPPSSPMSLRLPRRGSARLVTKLSAHQVAHPTRNRTQLSRSHSSPFYTLSLCLPLCSMLTATKRSGRCGLHCVDSITFPCRDIDPLDFFVLSNSPRQSVHISTCGPRAEREILVLHLRALPPFRAPTLPGPTLQAPNKLINNYNSH